MKCVLLLAAVYSLIIHQWHKEKGTSLAKTEQQQKFEVKQDKVTNQEAAMKFTAASQLFSLYSQMKNE